MSREHLETRLSSKQHDLFQILLHMNRSLYLSDTSNQTFSTPDIKNNLSQNFLLEKYLGRKGHNTQLLELHHIGQTLDPKAFCDFCG